MYIYIYREREREIERERKREGEREIYIYIYSPAGAFFSNRYSTKHGNLKFLQKHEKQFRRIPITSDQSRQIRTNSDEFELLQKYICHIKEVIYTLPQAFFPP